MNEFGENLTSQTTKEATKRIPDAMPNRTITSGTIVGDYEILEVIARGGMGVVYKARQLSLDRIVALKMILAGQLASNDDVKRFHREAEAAAHLDHPQIVPIYEVGQSDGQHYFSMGYVAGGTLAARLSTRPLAPRSAAELMLKVTNAIHYAHELGVIHRDIKPANILLDERGEPRISDFGIAKRLVEHEEQLTFSGAVVGSPSYMAPEQAMAKANQIGPATDVYALGVTLYALVCSRPPFQSDSGYEVLRQVVEQDPVSPRVMNSRVDSDLEAIILKCMQKSPALRYPSAKALADDLRAYVAGELVSARSLRIRDLINRAFQYNPHSSVLRLWGRLWMSHSVVLLTLCTVTGAMQWAGVSSRVPYLSVWFAGLAAAFVLWRMRRRFGPVSLVERQVAHVWAADVLSMALVFIMEMAAGVPVLSWSPFMAVANGAAFLVKASLLSGEFYIQSAALFATGILMILFPQIGMLLLGLVAAVSFFIPGLKYYRLGSADAR